MRRCARKGPPHESHRSPVAVASARIERGAHPIQQRVSLIDVTRGLLFLLMTSAHALALSKVSDDSFWRSAYWLPHGWATVLFHSLIRLYDGVPLTLAGPSSRHAYQIAPCHRDILVVMFVSNVVFLALRHVADGTSRRCCIGAGGWDY